MNSVEVGERSLSFVGDTDTLELSIKGINIDASLVGKAYALKMIPASIDAFTVTNLTLVLQLYTDSSNDEVHYKVGGMSYFHVDDFSVKMGQWIWQKLVNLNHGMLLSLLNTGLGHILPAYLHGKVDAFNA